MSKCRIFLVQQKLDREKLQAAQLTVMSKDVEKVHIIEQNSDEEAEAEEEEEEEEEQENDDQKMKLLAMEDLVPITQTLITPSLARLFNLNVQPQQQQQQRQQFLEGIMPVERSHGALSNDEFQHMQLQEDYHSSKAEEGDSKLSADDPCLQIMRGTFMDRNLGVATASYKRSHFNAGLEGYPMQLGDDGIDDHAEDFGMNHLLERENSSNSGDGAGSGGGGGGGGGARTLKRPRLVWTPQLHKRFVDAVSHLGIKNAVPKTIMQLMNVDGLTRENVASHLQKYRLYLRRVQQGNHFSSCANSPNKSILGGLDHHHLIGSPLSPAGSSDHLFSSSIPSTNMASNNHAHHHHHRTPGHINPIIPPHMQSLLLQQPQHQLNQAMAMIKSPPFTNQHLNPQRFSSNAVNSSSPTQRSSWPSPHSSIMDINALHHVESNGTAGSSPPRRALTLFPH